MIFIFADPPQPAATVYVSVDTPTPAATGSNLLVPVITPLPVHTPPAGVACSVITVSLKQIRTAVAPRLILDVPFTVIVNVLGVPTQPADVVGVTVIVATAGKIVLLVAMKLAILPVPAAASPILGLSFVQL